MPPACDRLDHGLRPPRTEPVEIHCEPGPYKPQMNGKRKASLIAEFERRSGDHNVGGSTRRPLVTAYREEALCIAAFLERHGPAQVRDVRRGTGIERCGAILRDNYYNWFERVTYGVYELTTLGTASPAGLQGGRRAADELELKRSQTVTLSRRLELGRL